MRFAELKAELAERADITQRKADQCLRALAEIFVEWCRTSDGLFPLLELGVFTKNKYRIIYKPSRQAIRAIRHGKPVSEYIVQEMKSNESYE